VLPDQFFQPGQLPRTDGARFQQVAHGVGQTAGKQPVDQIARHARRDRLGADQRLVGELPSFLGVRHQPVISLPTCINP
jgi:hypothetical protein